MYVTMMMTDQMLELPPLLNGEVPMMHHMINGDASQQVSQRPVLETCRHVPGSAVRLFLMCLSLQVILVQVNPGETFTIRREDGTLQCIQGLPTSLSVPLQEREADSHAFGTLRIAV